MKHLIKLILSFTILTSNIFCMGKKTDFDLIDIQKINPNIRLDIRYATSNNFTGQVIYESAKCYLKKEAAAALDMVQKELELEHKLCLKIWDGYRPLAAQWKLWNIVPNPKYVADPRKGGFHTRAMAVDLTLVDKDGKELEMGTGFDDGGIMISRI